MCIICAVHVVFCIADLCGKRADASTYSSAYIADIKEWLMDADRCITEYQPLLTLRAQAA